MTISGIRIFKIGERTFLQGQFDLQKDAWNVGRINPGPLEHYVWGKLSFWNGSGEVIAKIPYAVFNESGAGQGDLTTSLLLPVDNDLSSTEIATLQDTFPYYFGLPVPPNLNLVDPEGKVLLGLLRMQKTGDYTIANAFISGKLTGSHDYNITLTFYDADDHLLGESRIHQRMNGPLTPEQASPEDGGVYYQIELVGRGDWKNYYRVGIHVDKVSD